MFDDFEQESTEDDKKRTCKEAYIQIKKGIDKLAEEYNECKYFFTFYCAWSECKANPHPAKVEFRGNYPRKLKCTFTCEQCNLPNGYEIWNIKKKLKLGMFYTYND